MSKKSDPLGDRMKEYETVPRTYLKRRVPVIIRLDGKAFHTFTKGMVKPFDRVLMKTMQETMRSLCGEIQGCVLGYTQSDEITLVLTDYATITTDVWFGYGVQKMCSVAASMATLAFDRAWRAGVNEWESSVLTYTKGLECTAPKDVQNLAATYNSTHKKALFDARVFNLPKEEVCNCLIWRQKDAVRNSISSVGQAYFSHSQLHEKSSSEILEMLAKEQGVLWADYPLECQRGSCCYKINESFSFPDPRNADNTIPVIRRRWVVDHEIPLFTEERNYIEQWL